MLLQGEGPRSDSQEQLHGVVYDNGISEQKTRPREISAMEENPWPLEGTLVNLVCLVSTNLWNKLTGQEGVIVVSSR